MLNFWIDDADVLDAILGDRRRDEHTTSDQDDEDEPGYDNDTEHARRDE